MRATVALAAFLLAAAGDAVHAQQLVTTTYGPFNVTSTSGTQLSSATYTQTVTTAGVLRVKYAASSGHCSDVRAHIFVDGVNRGTTSFLSAGQTSGFVDVGPVSAGPKVVALQGEGRVGGCNTGVLVGWGGTMDVMTSVPDAPAAAVPAPGLLATLLAFAAGALWLGPWRRRRQGH